MIPRAVVNSVLVRVDWEQKSEMQYKSLKLYINPLEGKMNDSYDPTGHRQTKGVVASLPLGFDDNPFISRISKEICVGDLVYFHYNSIDEDTRIEYEGVTYYQLPYDAIFVAITRYGEWNVIGGRVLAKPIIDPDIQEIEVDGRRVLAKMSKSGIIIEMFNEFKDGHDLKKAKLVNIGTPLEGDPTLLLKPGDVVYYQRDSDFENWIEGEKFFVMAQEDLLFKQLN